MLGHDGGEDSKSLIDLEEPPTEKLGVAQFSKKKTFILKDGDTQIEVEDNLTFVPPPKPDLKTKRAKGT